MKSLALVLILGLSTFAVQASSDVPPAAKPAPVAENAAVETGADTTAADPAVVVTTEVAPQSSLNCVRDTGTRIKHRDKHGCTGAAGSSYTRADIDRTGAGSTAEALRMLHPGVSVNGH